jgi:chromosome segregation ATPase
VQEAHNGISRNQQPKENRVAETLNTRVTRLENAMAEMALAQTRLIDAVTRLGDWQASLAEEQRRLTEAQAHFTEAQARLMETQTEIRRESEAREKRIGERIEKLVIAIGEFISQSRKQT